MDPTLINLLGRLILINTLPFFLILSLIIRRRRQSMGVDPRNGSKEMSELVLLADEIKCVGVLGYIVILSIFFFSIPAVRYMHDQKGYDILLVEPDGYTVLLIGTLSFSLAVSGIYLQVRRRWAYRLLLVQMTLLLAGAFFSILDIGFIGIVPIIVFSYLMYKLQSPALTEELFRDK